MHFKALHIQFTYDPAEIDIERTAARLAPPIAETQGLCWKLWLINPDQRCAGGLYVFQDPHSLCAYLDGPIIADLRRHPALSDLQMRVFDVLAKPSLKTRAPLPAFLVSPSAKSGSFDPGL